MKKVLIISRGVPAGDNDQLGIFEFDQATALKKSGVDVSVLALDLRSIRRKRKFGIIYSNINGMDVTIASFPLGNIPKNIFYYLGSKIFYRAFNKILKKKRINIFHSHFYEIGMIISKCKLPTTVKWVHTEHSSFINRDDIDKKIIDKSNFYKKANQVIAVSNALKKRIDIHFGIKSICIPNIIDLDCFKYIKREEKGEFVFVTTANLVKIKKIDFLIKNFISVFKYNCKVKLFIVGDGREYTTLNNIIISNNQEEHIKLLGRLSRQDINKLYKQCDCFVLLSDSETFGVAYVEALATGLPVIASECGGPEDFVNETNGYIIGKDDEEKLRRTLKEITFGHEFNSSSIANDIREHFNSVNIAKKINETYDDVLNS